MFRSSEAQHAEESGHGPALRRKLTPRSMEYGAHTSILGRLHSDGVDLQKPRTPGATEAEKAAQAQKALPKNQDSQYTQSIATLSVYAEEYLKQISAPVSSNAEGQTDAHPLFLIEQSRLKHQQANWMRHVTSTLTSVQQTSLESHVLTLGTAIQSGNRSGVSEFLTTTVSSMEKDVARAMLANHQILDAWLDFLYAHQDYPSLLSLFQLRLALGVSPSEYAMSRKAMCKVLCAAAVEGDLVASMQVLRESSWGALSSSSAAAASESVSTSVNGQPSSAHKLPSWVPSYYSSDAAAQASGVQPPRTPTELMDGPDALLVKAAEEYSPVEKSATHSAAQESAAPIVQRPVSIIRPVAYRPQSFSSFSTLLGGALLSSAPQQTVQTSAAGMSTRARPRIAPIQVHTPPPSTTIAAAASAAQDPTPITPLPILDLFTELTLDSRLMELALLSSIRAEFRSEEFARREQREDLARRAKENPMAENEEMNLSVHEHAQAIFQATKAAQAAIPQATALNFDQPAAVDEDDSSQPKSIFSIMNDPSSRTPMAFQLWSLMLAQQVPLAHSHTYVALLENLQAHLAEMPRASANLLVQTLSNEMQFARTSGALKHKFLRSDVRTFLTHELALHQALAVEEDGADSVWSCLATLKQMHQEAVTPSVATVAQLYHSILTASDPSFGRSVLLQDLLTLAEDFDMSEQVIDQAIAIDAEQQKAK
jgi:hypothetical protein